MSKYRSLILVISISVLFSGLVSAQERVQETRLLAKTGYNSLILRIDMKVFWEGGKGMEKSVLVKVKKSRGCRPSRDGLYRRVFIFRV